MSDTRVLELFGFATSATPPTGWRTVVKAQNCPFLSRRCWKVRKSQPEISIGTCSVRYGRRKRALLICPSRLLERQQVFTDSLHLLTLHQPGNELRIISEVTIPGGSVAYFVVSVCEGRVEDFVGIEFQTLDTTGTVWPERQRFIASAGVSVHDSDVESTKSFGMNWKMTGKTILVQLHHKLGTFEHINKHLLLVLQDHLADYMSSEFDFSDLRAARLGDAMHIHCYSVVSETLTHQIKLSRRYSTDLRGIEKCLDLQQTSHVELDEIVKALEAKLPVSTPLAVDGSR